MHQNLGYLFAAFAVTWLAIFAYLLYVQHLLGQVRTRLQWLQEDREPRESGPPRTS